MTIEELSGKSVCILGFGREGKAMLAAIENEKITCDITIADQDPEFQISNGKCQTQSGATYLNNLDHLDVIIKSPGIPPSALSQSIQSKITNSTQIFLDTAIARGATVIGITGSKGKSTTSSLIHAILQRNIEQKAAKSQKPMANSYLVGNIGEPSITYIDQANTETTFVLEMSSYQLMDLTTSPHIAIITSFFPDHLDYHETMENYLEAKQHITRFQSENDIVFFCADSPGAVAIAQEGEGRKIPFTHEDAPVALEDTHLIGEHNLENIAGATLVAQELGIPEETIIDAIKNFHGLPHRLQSIGVIDGIEWIDDAISTTPESTIAGLKALDDHVQTLILGGQDRGIDFTILAEHLAQSSVKTVILFSGSGPRIRKAIEETKASIKLFDASSMKEAVIIAKKQTPTFHIPHSTFQPPIVLLSTASPSYGMFKNFEEKGEEFQRCIEL